MGVPVEEGETGTDSGAGRDDYAGGEEGGDAEDTQSWSAAEVEFLRRVLDDAGGPVAGAGDEDGEAFVVGNGLRLG